MLRSVTGIPLRSLDLNLLVMLEALLDEQNVTRAAARLGVTQPSASAALGKLRRHFGDEILARSGNTYELTPLGLTLRSLVGAAVDNVSRVFDATPDFDPGSTTREFTLVVSDYAAAVLGDHLASVMSALAPHSRLRLQAQGSADVDEAPDSLRSVDGMLLPHGYLSELPSIEVYEDSWVLVVSADNEQVGRALSLGQIEEMPWVMPHQGRGTLTPAARQLAMLGVEPRVELSVESFLALPFLIAGTPRVGLLQRHLAAKLAVPAGVRLLPCPWDVVPLREVYWWHPKHEADAGHAWFRDAILEAGRRVQQTPHTS
jgi:DNA-binding transcriptional LysR family regulator